MKLVDKQVLRELIGPFIFGVMAFSSVFFAMTYMLKLTNWVMSGMSLITAVEIVLLILPTIVVYTLPMATLLAVLLGVGRLSGDSETVALFAGGVSFYRIATPILLAGMVVSGSFLVLNELVSPRAYAHYQEIQADVMKQITPDNQPFTVRDDSTNSQILVKGGMDTKTGVLRDVTVTQFSGQIPAIVLYAKRATWLGIADKTKRYRWQLYDGWSQLVGTDSTVMTTFTESRTREVEIDKTPEQFALYQKSTQKDSDQLSFRELSLLVRYIRSHPDRPQTEVRKLEVNKWNRLALPLSSMVFAMLAAPLGIRPYRSSSSVGFGLSILVISIYWMVWNYTSSLAIQGNLPPIVGAFMADVLGIAAAIVLTRRAAK